MRYEDITDQDLKTFLIEHQTQLKELCKSYTDQLHELLENEDSVFKDDIRAEFKDAVSDVIIEYMSRSLGVGTDRCNEVIEYVNLIDYLGV